MRCRHLSVFVLLICCIQMNAAQSRVSPKGQARIAREVRHQILMLPYFGVFDNITYQVNGYNVALAGQVIRPTLKSDVERAVKKIEGVEKVDNRIEVLPVSINDDRLRQALFNSIYGYAPLQRYGVGSNRPIHIIVKNGHAILEGVVDSQGDKNLAGIRANSVPGIFSVINNLQFPGKK